MKFFTKTDLRSQVRQALLLTAPLFIQQLIRKSTKLFKCRPLFPESCYCSVRLSYKPYFFIRNQRTIFSAMTFQTSKQTLNITQCPSKFPAQSCHLKQNVYYIHYFKLFTLIWVIIIYKKTNNIYVHVCEPRMWERNSESHTMVSMTTSNYIAQEWKPEKQKS